MTGLHVHQSYTRHWQYEGMVEKRMSLKFTNYTQESRRFLLKI